MFHLAHTPNRYTEMVSTPLKSDASHPHQEEISSGLRPVDLAHYTGGTDGIQCVTAYMALQQVGIYHGHLLAYRKRRPVEAITSAGLLEHQ